MKRRVSVALQAIFRSMLSGVRAIVAVAAFLFTTAVNADDYGTIAAAVASPLVEKFEDIEKAYTDGQVMLRIELARQHLQSATAAADLSIPRQNILMYLDACHRSMEEIRRLDGKVPDIEQIAKKALAASPALVRTDPETGGLTKQDGKAVDDLTFTLAAEGLKALANAWKASTERDNYRNHYRLARKEALSLADVAKNRCKGSPAVGYGVGIAANITAAAIIVDEPLADGPAVKAGIRKGDEIIAVNGKTVKRQNGTMIEIDHGVFDLLAGPQGSTVKLTYARDEIKKTVELSRTYGFPIDIFEIDLNGSWNATFPHDGLSLRNISDRELTNCTLLVTVVGTHGDSDNLVREQHLHFVEKWPANQRRYTRYHSSNADGIARDESVDRVRGLVIELFSGQYRATIEYEYAGTRAFDEDVARYVGLIEKNQTFKLIFIGNNPLTDAGVSFQHDGKFTFIPDPKLTVTLRRGNDVRTVVFPPSGKIWKSGFLSAYALKHQTFNGMIPERADVDIEFPGSRKNTSFSWNFSDR